MFEMRTQASRTKQKNCARERRREARFESSVVLPLFAKDTSVCPKSHIWPFFRAGSEKMFLLRMLNLSATAPLANHSAPHQACQVLKEMIHLRLKIH